MTPEDIMIKVEAVTAPDKMTPKEALDFLESLSSLIDGSIEGLRHDLRNSEPYHDDEDEKE